MFGWFRRNGSGDALSRGAPLADAIPTEAERRDELLSAYLDADLTSAERDQLDARLATDTDLRDALEGMRLVRDTLATLEPARAPRSFAITAPPVPQPRRAFGRLDLVTRIGAMTAAVAFVVVLAGDLTGAGTPIADQSFSTTAEIAAIQPEPAADGGAAGGSADSAGEVASGGSERSTSDGPAPAPAAATEEAAPPPASSSSDAAEAAPTEAAPLPAEATVEAAAAASTDLQATAAADAGTGGGSAAAGGDSSDPQAPLAPEAGNAGADAEAAATSEAPTTERALPAPGTEVETATAGDEAATASDGDSTRVEDGTNTGTSDIPPSLAPQTGEASTMAPTTEPPSALIQDDDAVSSLAIVLGAVAAAFIATASLLWWRRRGGAIGPA